jgi:hypothetical protein
MIVVYGVLVYGLGLALFGLILLACIPGLRLTFANLFLFVVGGFVGVGAAGYLLSLIFRVSEGSRLLGLLAWAFVAVGAAIGGTGLVWLKARLIKR